MSSTTSPILNFMKYKTLYFAISLAVILPGLYFLLTGGLKPAIDFTGGSVLELKLDPQVTLSQEQITSIAQNLNLPVASLTLSTENLLTLRSAPIDKSQSLDFQAILASEAGGLNPIATASATTSASLVVENQFATLGPTLGTELLQKTLVSVILAASSILLYIGWRFKNLKFGVTAIIAMFHDTLIILGVFAILGHFFSVQVDTLFVTALLTILSFSVHDTIVVYDRIRESQKRFPKADITDLINKAVAETLPRSINNSMTIIFMLLSLFLFGGVTIRWFVFALLVGTIAGTYSSTFTAAPLLDLWFHISHNRKKAKTIK